VVEDERRTAHNAQDKRRLTRLGEATGASGDRAGFPHQAIEIRAIHAPIRPRPPAPAPVKEGPQEPEAPSPSEGEADAVERFLPPGAPESRSAPPGRRGTTYGWKDDRRSSEEDGRPPP